MAQNSRDETEILLQRDVEVVYGRKPVEKLLYAGITHNPYAGSPGSEMAKRKPPIWDDRKYDDRIRVRVPFENIQQVGYALAQKYRESGISSSAEDALSFLRVVVEMRNRPGAVRMILREQKRLPVTIESLEVDHQATVHGLVRYEGRSGDTVTFTINLEFAAHAMRTDLESRWFSYAAIHFEIARDTSEAIALGVSERACRFAFDHLFGPYY